MTLHRHITFFFGHLNQVVYANKPNLTLALKDEILKVIRNYHYKGSVQEIYGKFHHFYVVQFEKNMSDL